MAVGTVSGVSPEDQWQLITSTTASGTSMTFNSFTGYKHLWLVGKAITKNTTTHISIRPNNNSTAGNYSFGWTGGTADKFLVSSDTASAQAVSFKIYNVDQTYPKHVACSYDNAYPSQEQDAFLDTVAVTSLVIYTYNGTSTFSGGTFYLYGIPA